MNATELSPEQLFHQCDPEQLPFDTTHDLTDLSRFFGQPHGLGADFRLLVRPSLKGLAQMIRMESTGPVVLPCEISPFEDEQLCSLMDELANPVLLVR